MESEIRRIEIEEVESAKAKANKFGGIRFEVLDVTELALLRPDGHPDTWNEIFLEMMKWDWKGQPRSEE
ncbi:protein YLS7-like [Trifolium medium]|uniref:Protein YLS7-like n=1 Tax=Trifolium medium TaxID=97028 RepID=A0A392PWA6_9FABA|nr:protein YLS7-like [Trifolium medium]